MNFKKLFSWRKSAEEQELEYLESMRTDSGSPRPLHYIFAHRLLPQLAFHHGIMAALTLGDPASEFEYLPRLWETAGKHLLPGDAISPTGLNGMPQRVGEFRVTIVTFPPPERNAEVYFAAIVCGPITEAEEAPFQERAQGLVAQIMSPPDRYFQLRDAFSSHRMLMSRPAPTRYYTLEMGEAEDHQKRTVFCAWTPVGEHLNFGDGPEPNPEAFLAQVVSTLSESPLIYGSSSPRGLRGPDGEIIWEEEVRKLKEEDQKFEQPKPGDDSKPRW